MMSSISIRQAVGSDLYALVSLDALSNPHPWGESLVLDALKTRKNWVIERVEKVSGQSPESLLGWLTASQWGDQSELELIVVSLDARRQGLAKKLMTEWLANIKHEGVSEFLLEVRESNVGAISLYESLNFELVGRRKNYYQTEQGHEAACLFTLKM
ncbi:GCN5 family acetyltransferase [Marinomonas ushuaiensis DSM 15871]|uniref:GCN5 family acetyltransferase n=1 Tax=Marinomonas ushuaiensis DSM 15871 TaxID=1122207 RepID=X7E0A7_9GAMM|nr:N-acetyltransferase [Marinomonas ushuaiensis]ETX09489.1 GCN5 family acetyltransferase [Marinomonas ushuaiensis DSM 15871]